MIKACASCRRVYRDESDFLTDTFFWRLDNKKNLHFTCGCGSSMVLKSGSYDWYTPDKTLRPEAKDLFNTLSLGNIMPQLPTGVLQVRQLLASSTVEVGPLVAALKQEPLLLADVLRTADLLNKAEGNKIKSIEHAIVYIGLNAVNDLVTIASMRCVTFKTKHFSFKEFWRESLLTGCLAERIAQSLNLVKNPEEAYLAGCLANIGKAVYANCLPDMADQIYLHSQQNRMPWRGAEIALGLPNHAVLGEIAATFWALPKIVVQSALNHHEPPQARSRQLENASERTYVNLISFATQLKSWLLEKPFEVDEHLLYSAGRQMGLTLQDVGNLANEYFYLKDAINDTIENQAA